MEDIGFYAEKILYNEKNDMICIYHSHDLLRRNSYLAKGRGG